MIWECTVCSNHFDGDSPPDLCHSCGSPRQYFHRVSPLWSRDSRQFSCRHDLASQQACVHRNLDRAMTCFRFHAAKHFLGKSEDFYRNFLETRRTFLERNRFAGRGFNSGFYFATTRESAIAEKLHYSKVAPDETMSEPQAVLSKLRSLGSDCLFLEVTLSLQRVADLTDPIVLEYFLREGPARANIRPTGVPYELARLIVPTDIGGSKHTDGIGYHACSNGWNAVEIPECASIECGMGHREPLLGSGSRTD